MTALVEGLKHWVAVPNGTNAVRSAAAALRSVCLGAQSNPVICNPDAQKALRMHEMASNPLSNALQVYFANNLEDTAAAPILDLLVHIHGPSNLITFYRSGGLSAEQLLSKLAKLAPGDLPCGEAVEAVPTVLEIMVSNKSKNEK